jgi:hypothetical protein
MISKSDPWYVHAALYAVIVILVIILVKVAIIDPNHVVERENYFKTESRARMKNLKEGEMLWFKKHKQYTGNLDSLIAFLNSDSSVDSAINSRDTLINKSTNPFAKLATGNFVPDSLYRTPKSHSLYTLQVDTSMSVDTVVSRRGRILKIDTTKHIGSKYYIEDPDGYGTVGSITNEALKNTASWEQ